MNICQLFWIIINLMQSEIERKFAIDAENDDVVLYAKLPSRFKIDTPIGNYNPVEVIDTGINFEVVKELKSLKQFE